MSTMMSVPTPAAMAAPSAGLRVQRRAPGLRAARHVRLTRRGRLAVVLALAALLFAAFSLGRVGAEGSTSSAPAPSVSTTVVPGETLWSVAKRIAPGQDPRPVVEEIRRINSLPDAGLRAGQQLLLPGPA
jgi:Tfp pilus assembly protein FimV